jgi:transcriptional regulator with XRE-family HTH domain
MKSLDIKEIRKNYGWTQDQLAKKMGVSLKTITNYESGGVIPESKSALLRELLNVNITETPPEIVPRAVLDGYDKKIKEINEKINSRNQIIELLAGNESEIKHHKEMIELLYTQIDIITAAKKESQL